MAVLRFICQNVGNGGLRGMRNMKDLSGMRFGKLTAIEPIGKDAHGGYVWRCVCDCGNEHIVRSGKLICGNVTSCGCVRRKRCGDRFRTHGCGRTKLYKVWKSMRDRCLNPKNRAYISYGGRGITVCSEWNNSYESFRDWALSNGYSGGLSIDRVNNDKGYYPENCRWATSAQQANNKRNNKEIEYNGETHTISEWERILGFKKSSLNARLRMGWSVERALTTPLRERKDNE